MHFAGNFWRESLCVILVKWHVNHTISLNRLILAYQTVRKFTLGDNKNLMNNSCYFKTCRSTGRTLKTQLRSLKLKKSEVLWRPTSNSSMLIVEFQQISCTHFGKFLHDKLLLVTANSPLVISKYFSSDKSAVSLPCQVNDQFIKMAVILFNSKESVGLPKLVLQRHFKLQCI